MAYEPYATADDYFEYGNNDLSPDELRRRLRAASRHIDSLTFNRICEQGFDALTEFQQDIIREVVCRQVDFEYDNEEALETVLQSYSINGVNMSMNVALDGVAVHVCNGVAMSGKDWALLNQTGLTCRLGVFR